jgi:signal transduction histidine kinase
MIDRIEASVTAQRQFIADASHEIRTPLTVVFTELEYIAQRLTDPALRESVQESIAEVDRLAKLAGDLLILARLDATQPSIDKRPLRLDELLLECIQRERAVAGKKSIEMLVDIPEPIEISADREKLKSVFLNLLDNAIKYSPPGAIVTSRLWVERDGHPSAFASVTDTGPGIPAAEWGNIFRRFYRIDRAREETQGSGLGLAIVGRIMEIHGGTVTVQSTVGAGSTFTLRLPMNSSG